MRKKYRVIFADLDGTLIEPIYGDKFPLGIWDMQLKFDVLAAIKVAAPETLCIVSNQGGIEKGYVDLLNFQIKLKYVGLCIEEFCGINASWRYCGSNNPNNYFRKPNIGLLQGFYEEYYDGLIGKEDMLMIGDASGKEGQFSDTDKSTAINYGIDYLDVQDFVNIYTDEL